MTTIGTSLPGTVGLSLAGPSATEQKAELAKAAKAFEAIFARQLIGSMRQSSLGDDLTGSDAVNQFQDMADSRTADAMAEHGGLGIAQMLLQQLDKKPASGAATNPSLTMPKAFPE